MASEFDPILNKLKNNSFKKLFIKDFSKGSILFISNKGLVSQNNSGLFWDEENKQLGIMKTPNYALDVKGNINIDNSYAYLYDGVTILKVEKSYDENYRNTYVGANAGSGTIKQTAIGSAAGYQSTGDYQVLLGEVAGYQSTGDYQTALGYFSAIRNHGIYQTSVGYYSGYGNTGNYQTALGGRAGYNNVGDYQTAIGYDSGTYNTKGYQMALGFQAGKNNAGLYQTAIGYTTGKDNTADFQTAIGLQAGCGNTGKHQVAYGTSAGHVNTGNFQTAFGSYTGDSNSGHRVIGIGYEATRVNSGDDVVAIGYQAGKNNSVHNQLIIQQVNINSIPLIQGDFITGNVGIGLTTPGEKLVVNGNIFLNNDNSKLLLGLDKDVSIYYDGINANINTGLINPSDLIIDCGVEKTVELSTVVWDDQQVNIGDIAGKGWFGNSWSDIVEYRSGEALRLANSSFNNYRFKFNTQLSHKYKEGEDILFHLHIGNNSTNSGNVVLKFTWEWSSINSNFINSVSETKTFTINGVEGLHQVFDFSNSLSGVNKKVSSIILANIERLADDSGDTFSEDVYVIGVDYHVPLDTVGSRQEWVK